MVAATLAMNIPPTEGEVRPLLYMYTDKNGATNYGRRPGATPGCAKMHSFRLGTQVGDSQGDGVDGVSVDVALRDLRGDG